MNKILQKGLGRAIFMIRKDYHNQSYKDLVLENCLRITALNAQDEGTKAVYLYNAMKELKTLEANETFIIDKFLQDNNFWLQLQLFEFLQLYIKDEYVNSRDAILEKYNLLLKECENEDMEILFEYGKRELLETIAKYLLKNDLLNYSILLDDFEMLASINVDRIFFDDLIETFLESKISTITSLKKNHPILITNYLRDKQSVLKYQNNRSTITTVEELLKVSNDSFYPLYIGFSHKASPEEILKLAHLLHQMEDDLFFKYLKVFRIRKYPLNPIFLIEKYDNCMNNEDRELLLDCFEHLSHPRIKEIAKDFININNYDYLNLLKYNVDSNDIPFLEELIINNLPLNHETIMPFTSLFNSIKLDNSYNILYHLYLLGECSACRHSIVKAMIFQECITIDILNECIYDSYEETRNLAHSILKGYFQNTKPV